MGVLSDRQIRDLCQDTRPGYPNKPMITPYAPGIKREGIISFGQTSYGYDVRLGYKFKVFTGAKLTNAIIDPKHFDPAAYIDVDLTPVEYPDHHVFESHLSKKCFQCGQEIYFDIDFRKDDPFPKGPCVPPKPNHIIIPPHSFVLGESVETFNIPRDILVICVGKSTYARCALVVNVTPGEPEWEGKWTIELSNTAPMPVKVYCGEGIMQCVFLRSDERDEGLFRTMEVTFDRTSKDSRIYAIGHAVDLLRCVREKQSSCETSYKDKKGKYQNQEGLTLPTVDGKKD